MADCCSGFCTSVARQFDATVAAGDLKRYLRNGPNPTTRLLRDGVLRAGGGQSLLDIGAGIGALSIELLGAGFGRSLAVDASPAYVAMARQEAGARGLSDRLTVLEADFTHLAETGDPVDAVVMDRVVCCYPEFRPLLQRALRSGGRLFAYSYPRDRWYVRWVIGIENVARAMLRNPFRAVVHSAEAMGACITGEGFTRTSRSGTIAWVVDVYVRVAP
jgi:ubiquinone/menaquinone biosynthesis C-methylase UbiE